MARKPAVSFIFLTLVLDITGIGIVVPVLPALLEELIPGASDDRVSFVYGWLIALYALMQFLFSPLLGALSDRFGRRPVILISLFGAGLDYFVLWLAPSLWWFVAARIIAGICAANMPAATAYIADVSPPEKRAANFGMIGAAFGIGFVVGPAIGGLIGAWDTRLPFLVAGILTLGNAIYGIFVLPESLTKKNRRPFEWRRANPIGALLSLRRYPMVIGLAGALFLYSLAHQVLPSTWALYTEHRYNWTSLEIGLSLSLVGVMAVIVSGGLARKLIPKWGERKTVLIAGMTTVLSFICYGSAGSAWMIYLIIIFGSLGGLFHAASQGLISKSVGDHEQGRVQGAMASLVGVAGIFGPLISTSLHGYFISPAAPLELPGAPFFAGAAMTLIAIGLAARSFRRE
ncbi:MAG: DHA1 family tetracycline resistance protein-like MFS transporter [Verrucomicrobiales bacterium]|jgi:DHA1 family tetracycline resistance protein-like MFS transporter